VPSYLVLAFACNGSTVRICGCIIPFKHTRLMAFYSRTTWVSRHQKGRTILDFNEARDDGVALESAGPYANHLHLTPDTSR